MNSIISSILFWFEKLTPQKNYKEIKSCTPPAGGWLDYKLNQEELDYVWKCVNRKSYIDYRENLAGNITSSRLLIDENNYFYENVLKPLLKVYSDQFGIPNSTLPISGRFPFHLREWWVNYQYQNEFNPLHDHSGVYSFVIWLKIPTNHAEQNVGNESNRKCKGSFSFQYTGILGDMRTYWYNLSKEDEGTLLLFPSKLSHQVYPFYDCDEDRISVSGNIFLDGYNPLE